MKKDLIIIAALLAAGATKAETTDSVKTVNLQDVVVNGVRAQKNAPYAVANINQEKLETFSKTGQELPFLLAQTPGVIGWEKTDWVQEPLTFAFVVLLIPE